MGSSNMEFSISSDGEHLQHSLLEAAIIVEQYNDAIDGNLPEEYRLGPEAVLEVGESLHQNKRSDRHMQEMIDNLKDEFS